MYDGGSFKSLMQEVAAGSPQAAETLVEVYGDSVLRVIRSRLNRLLRRQLDSEDIRQIVWASFFAHRSQYSRFERPEELLAFLRSMAANKVIDQCRRRIGAARRSRLRERGMDSSGIESMDSFPGRDERPSAAVAVREQLELMSPQERQIVEFRMAGETTARIAEELGVSERTVYRILQALARRQSR
jgi:RNA polymerase sigma factor (sigma-70 family)